MASSMQSLQASSWFLIQGCSKAWGAVIRTSGSTTSSFFTKSEAKEDLRMGHWTAMGWDRNIIGKLHQIAAVSIGPEWICHVPCGEKGISFHKD